MCPFKFYLGHWLGCLRPAGSRNLELIGIGHSGAYVLKKLLLKRKAKNPVDTPIQLLLLQKLKLSTYKAAINTESQSICFQRFLSSMLL